MSATGSTGCRTCSDQPANLLHTSTNQSAPVTDAVLHVFCPMLKQSGGSVRDETPVAAGVWERWPNRAVDSGDTLTKGITSTSRYQNRHRLTGEARKAPVIQVACVMGAVHSLTYRSTSFAKGKMNGYLSFMDVTASLSGPTGEIDLGLRFRQFREDHCCNGAQKHTMTIGADGEVMHSLHRG